MKLDRYDLTILSVLQLNGRISKRELAEKIGLSVSPCCVRIRKLEEMGYITGYRATIDFERIARFCYVTTLVRLESHHSDNFRRFEGVMRDTPQVVHCEAVIGEHDYTVNFVTVDIHHYQNLIETLLERDLGIVSYLSLFRTKLIKNDWSDLLTGQHFSVSPEGE